MLFEVFKKLTSEYLWLLDFAAILALGFLFFKKVRVFLAAIAKWFYLYFTFPSVGSQALNDIKNKLEGLEGSQAKLTKGNKELSSEINGLKELIGYNGGTGLMDQVGFIAGFQSNEFWFREQPGFVCDETGRYLDCTHGYCRMLGLSSKEDLVGGYWKSYVEQDDLGRFVEAFQESAKLKESFRRTIKFYTSEGKYIGTWIAIASPISSEKAKTIRYMGFLYPFGDNAVEIAKNLGILTAPPI